MQEQKARSEYVHMCVCIT